jgi:hypothetical protein
VKHKDGSIIEPAPAMQIFQSAGHTLPSYMQNTSTNVYNEDVGNRWGITRFWDTVLTVDVPKTWNEAQEQRKAEYESLSQLEQDRRKALKKSRMEKARREREKKEAHTDVLQEYEEG